MHSNFLATVLIAISVANGIFAVPLSLAHAEPTTDEEKANLASLQEANAEANNQIPHMEKVLADPTNEKHKPLIEAAFGKDPSLDLNKVKENVQKLKTGTVHVDLKTAPTTKELKAARTLAWTRYDQEQPPMEPVHIEFVKKFHQSAKSTRAGTLIHEATHFLGGTTDYAVNGQVLKGNQKVPEDAVDIYTSKPDMYKTPKSLNGDIFYAPVRDSTRNMHDSAEAYGQFASLCANAKLSRRDYRNFRRALATDDDDSSIVLLVKRNACLLPKDSFKKKGGEKVAAVKKTPVSGAAPKAKGTAAKTLAKSKTGPHAGKRSSKKKSLLSGKVLVTKELPGDRTAKAIGKTAGSRRPTKKTKSTATAAHGGKHTTTPKSKAAAGSTAAGKKKVAAAGKRGAKTAAVKHVVARKKAASSKKASPVKHAVAAPKNAVPRTAAAKPKPATKAAPKKAAAKPRPVVKVTVKPVPAKPAAGKKGRRDIEFESGFDM
ncbi:hypothetical protein D9613_010268 [Agrocybe pediades]|uniref:Lysine-specific metallo-endopeptidase domain-containing protein n=1 Tax=Agrocybe pediades TaxID=84607 RepID=A0A8H4VJB5_9AGAR|nr:hypothetical protein D9613_010268 [Agrocybe pediades]